MTRRNIRKHLVKFNEAALPDSFVGFMVGLSPSKVPTHAGILIRLNGTNHFHHFSGRPQVMDNFNPSHWLAYKVIDLIKVDDESEVAAFLTHCRRICQKSNIRYSCTFDGSHYNANGEFKSASGLPELATCVGFCLNTIAVYAIDHGTYLQLDDWDADSIPPNFGLANYGQEQAFGKYPLLNVELYNAFSKRITPTEYLCSAFFDTYPVSKTEIDGIIEDVLRVIDEKF